MIYLKPKITNFERDGFNEIIQDIRKEGNLTMFILKDLSPGLEEIM